jgi:Flp pilus assembly pilin Flp
MTQLLARIRSIRNDDQGQGLAEYALILVLIALVAIIALIFLGTQVSTILDTVGKSVLDPSISSQTEAAGAERPGGFRPSCTGRRSLSVPGRRRIATLQASLRRARFPAVSS